MREPDFNIDGWCLEDGEELHLKTPDTFWIPRLPDRQGLRPGDYAKLIFRISVDEPEHPESVERMWVVVRERVAGGYLGILDNDPDCIEENEELWSGIELPFAPRHIIKIEGHTEESIALAVKEPRRRWSQS